LSQNDIWGVSEPDFFAKFWLRDKKTVLKTAEKLKNGAERE
jgi:hypothetical protein